MVCQATVTSLSVLVGNLRISKEDQPLPDVVQGRKNPLWIAVPARLRRLRKAASLSQAALSRLSGVVGAQISRIEAQLHTVSIDTVEKLSAGLGVPPSFLAFGCEGMQPFRLRTPQYLKTEDQPIPKPGKSSFTERYRGGGERLRSSRERLGLSLRGLAEAADVSYQAVLYTESGQTVPRVDTIEAIAVALDVAPGWLAYGDDD